MISGSGSLAAFPKNHSLFFFGIRDVKFVGTRGGTSAARVFRCCSTHVAALTYHKAWMHVAHALKKKLALVIALYFFLSFTWCFSHNLSHHLQCFGFGLIELNKVPEIIRKLAGVFSARFWTCLSAARLHHDGHERIPPSISTVVVLLFLLSSRHNRNHSKVVLSFCCCVGWPFRLLPLRASVEREDNRHA